MNWDIFYYFYYIKIPVGSSCFEEKSYRGVKYIVDRLLKKTNKILLNIPLIILKTIKTSSIF